ncbi:hypothetical protein CRUP_029227 [Coryphaenoides rupestris]|nr:hypothetical protein CRUP_029227 [Coryphaenoides rupestris]
MEVKNNFQCTIRGYEASDWSAVVSLWTGGFLEHVYPAFLRTAAHPDHMGVALSVCVAGYVLGGSSYLQALVFGGAWAGLLYHCCQEVYRGRLQRSLAAGLPDAKGPEGGLWVAEAEVGGRTRVVGVVAVRGKKGGAIHRGNRVVQEEEEEEEEEEERVAELTLMVVPHSRRRHGVGSLLAQKALDFCQARGYARLVVESSSPQCAANALYRKAGFGQTASHCETRTNRWLSKLARVDVLTLEKLL